MSDTIYNRTDGPLPIDDDGRMIGGRESMPAVDVEASAVSKLIANGDVVVIDQPDAELPEADVDEQPTAAPQASTDQPKRTRKGAASTSSQEG